MNFAELFQKQRIAGFPERLIEHHKLVSGVAVNLAIALRSLGIVTDPERAGLMGAVHDAGKSVVTEELSIPGSAHEAIGREVALRLGLPESISKICCSHSSDTTDELDTEEIVVRLADKLWKGKRDPDFEKQAVQRFSAELGKEDWEVFMNLDKIFESIAESGYERLEATRA
ncbi:HD domain-containing protein [Brevifollis gellanilyticus]|uniref:HD domain-containing protein n=1 Tax=Brevifollis gellanilyticus TaxID=748831 RepID=A0A512MBY0_9BACT|nr:HD domain-containing protein [Brevifollis gellanilyticus]GEP44239.1 hypothetical protein BGE01nite_35300 [Brevifollis gellanilyticus]